MPLDPKSLQRRPRSPLTGRLGRFKIARQLLANHPEDFQPVFAHVVIVEAIYRWEADSFEFLGYSAQFKEQPEGVAAPFYTAIIRSNSHGPETVEFKQDI